jgi:Tetraspanin family
MVKFSNNLVGFLNLLILLLSIPILAGGIWLSHRASTDCEKFLQKPVIALGVLLLLVSLAGFVGACCRQSCLLWAYLFVMFVLIFLLFCFTIFAFVVTNKGAGEVVSGRGLVFLLLLSCLHSFKRKVKGAVVDGELFLVVWVNLHLSGL